MTDNHDAHDGMAKLLQRFGLKPHQLPAARRWLAIGLLGLLALLAIDLVNGFVRSDSPGRPAAPVLAPSAPSGDVTTVAVGGDIAAWEERLNRDVAALLRQVQGAGEVAVFARLQGGPSQSFAQDVRTNTRTSLDTDERLQREQTEVDETVQTVMGGGGGSQPVVVAVASPTVESVVIIADGADDPAVRWRLQQAATGALGLPSHRIHIVAREVR